MAATMLLAHSMICLVVSKTIQERSSNPLKSYLLTLTFGLLHPESWPNLSTLKRASRVNKRRQEAGATTKEPSALQDSGR